HFETFWISLKKREHDAVWDLRQLENVYHTYPKATASRT
ncbi:hypothetical protein PC112_g24770, partial [Phytophthora cactorum]